MRTFAILLVCLMGVAMATATSTSVKAAPSKDLIDDVLAALDWALALLETLGINILDVLAQWLPAELVDILQILVDLGIIPIAKESIIDTIIAAIDLIIEQGLAAFDQLVDLIPEPILSILEELFNLGLFPSQAPVIVRQSIDEWLAALIDILVQLVGDLALDLLIQAAADFGISAELIQALWDLVIGGSFEKTSTHALRMDIIDWAIQLLEELGLEALAIIAEFLPPELISILVDLVLGIGLPVAK
jgi:hypothetical protein